MMLTLRLQDDWNDEMTDVGEGWGRGGALEPDRLRKSSTSEPVEAEEGGEFCEFFPW